MEQLKAENNAACGQSALTAVLGMEDERCRSTQDTLTRQNSRAD